MSKFKFLRKRTDYYRHFTVLDIGTDLIKVLVVRRDGLDGEVLGVGREPQAPAAMSGGAIADLESVIQSCNRALEAAEDMAKTVPGQVVVGIAGELIKGFSSTIAYPREASQSRVRSGEVSSMLQMVQRRALREAQHLLELERSYGQLEARLVHSAITNIRVDGYPVTNPVGFTGKNLEITVFNTFAPMTHIDAVDSVVRELDLELAGAVAQPYALARACASEETWAEGGLFVDVNGGTTDVTLVRERSRSGSATRRPKLASFVTPKACCRPSSTARSQSCCRPTRRCSSRASHSASRSSRAVRGCPPTSIYVEAAASCPSSRSRW